MKIQNSHYITLILVLLLIFISVEAQAQGLPIFDDDVDDEPVAPINGLIALGFAVGGYLGIRKVKE
jgi:hypothetical protein